MTYQIALDSLKVSARIGWTDEERKKNQPLVLFFKFWLKASLENVEENLTHTLDYAAVAIRVQKVIHAKERKLLETVLQDLLAEFAKIPVVEQVFIRLEKPEALNGVGVPALEITHAYTRR